MACRTVAIAFILVSSVGVAAEPARTVQGLYRNPALGFAVVVPRGLTGTAGDEAGPERGVGIRLVSGSSLTVFGEPNSLEWSTPADGVRWMMRQDPECVAGEVGPAPVGKLDGSGGRESCENTVVIYRLAFRSKGGPIYWLILETNAEHERADTAVLETVAASFRLIRWE